MKKVLSLIMLIALVLSMAIIPTSAADLDLTGRKNVLLDSGIFTYYDRLEGVSGTLGKDKVTVDKMFDGIITRGPSTGAQQNYCDFSINAGPWTDIMDNGTRYNELGDVDPNGKYLCYADFCIGDVYTVDALRVFLDEAENDMASDLLVDGFEFGEDAVVTA